MNPPSELLDKCPPQSLPAEAGVLGSILLDRKCLEEVAEVLQPADFYADANQKIYATMLAMESDRIPIDVRLLLERLTKDGNIVAVGGASSLALLMNNCPHAADAIYYAKIVREKSRLRKIIHTATMLLKDAWEPSAEPKAVLEDAERAFSAIWATDTDKGVVKALEATRRALDNIDAIYQRKRTAGLITGLEQFDNLFGGLFPGELVVLAARLKVGKTTLACQWADFIASRNHLTYFASLEMDAAALVTKTLCRLAGVSGIKIRNGSLTADEVSQLTTVGPEVSQRSIVFDERPRLKVSDIRREARKLARQGLAFVVVDYLQFVRPSDPRDTRERQVAAIAEDLKSLARELSVPVLALAQLNRMAEREGGGGAEGLRESDVIGQTADMVIRLDINPGKKATQMRDPANDEYWLRVVANRLGSAGKMRLSWNRDLGVFDSYETPAEQMDNYEHSFDSTSDRGDAWEP